MATYEPDPSTRCTDCGVVGAHECPPRRIYNVGDLVRTWWDEGADMGGGWTFGVVEKAGDKTATVVWESGNRNRVRQQIKSRGVDHVPTHQREAAAEVMERARRAEVR